MEDDQIHIPMSWIEVEAPAETESPSLPSRTGIPAMWKTPPGTVILPSGHTRYHSNTSSLSEYDPFAASPAAMVYAQAIPLIQRGRQAPFPTQPLLPPSLIPRIRAAQDQDVARYRSILLAGHSARASRRSGSGAGAEAQKSQLLTPSQPSANSKSFYSEDERNRLTTISAEGEGFDRTSFMTEEKSRVLREEFEKAVGKMVSEEKVPTSLSK